MKSEWDKAKDKANGLLRQFFQNPGGFEIGINYWPAFV
jgi:hypothetical protein